MDCSKLFHHIDHTLLRADVSWPQIQRHCEEAIRYQAATACIPPSYVAPAHHLFGSALRICTVVGFPLGYHATELKVYEITKAIADGADELDVVVNLGDIKNGDFSKVTTEIAALRRASGRRVLKIIAETCYLTEGEKISLARCVTTGGADYIKTSTGFGTGGAVLEDIELFLAYAGNHVRVKAAGGIRTRAEMERFVSIGCDRIGTSSAITALVESPTDA